MEAAEEDSGSEEEALPAPPKPKFNPFDLLSDDEVCIYACRANEDAKRTPMALDRTARRSTKPPPHPLRRRMAMESSRRKNRRKRRSNW